MKKACITDPSTPVGKALSTLCQARGMTLLSEKDADQADYLFFTARRACPMTILDTDSAALLGEIGYHVRPAFFLSQRVAKAMAQRKEGSMVLIGSGDADKPNGRAIGFSCSMGALQMLFRELCVHLYGSGVRCNWIGAAQAADTDDPEKTAALALDVALNPAFDGCQIQCDRAHFLMK